MAHNLDITEGIASFASAREHAWHRLGTVMPGAMTAEEALEAANMANWNVRKIPLQALSLDLDGVTTLDVPDKFATVRTNPVTGKVDYLGVVGDRYHPIQNEETTEFGNALIDESGAVIETAGALHGGRHTFVSMKMPETMQLNLPGGGTDDTDLYIAVLNSHDGTQSMRVLVTPIRIVCQNTQTLALRTAKSSFSIRHTNGAKAAIAEARNALRLTFRYVEEFEAEMQKLLETPMENEQMRLVFRDVFKVDQKDISERAKNGREGHVEACMDLLSAQTNSMIAGTAYAALNAVTEHADWTWKVRGADDQDAARAMRVLMPQFVDIKTRALELLSV